MPPPPRCPWATREGRARKRRGAGRGGGCNAGRTTGRGAELVHRGPGGARPTCHATTAAAAAVFAQLALRWGMGAQLGSSVAFGSGCGKALPGGARILPLCICGTIRGSSPMLSCYGKTVLQEGERSKIQEVAPYKNRGALRGTPGSACPQPEPNATELPSCARISARAAQRRQRRRRWRGGEGARRPGPEGQVLRHVLWQVLRNVLRRIVHVLVLHVSPKGGRGGGSRVRVAARRSIPSFAP